MLLFELIGSRCYAGSSLDVPSIRVYHPTWEEFKDFNKYIEKIEAEGAHKAGLAKIVPPKEWVPRKNGCNLRKDKELQEIKIPNPICQVGAGRVIKINFPALGGGRRKLLVVSAKYFLVVCQLLLSQFFGKWSIALVCRHLET